jgi:hypothetical protein
MTNTDTDFLHVLRQAEARPQPQRLTDQPENNYSELTAGDEQPQAKNACFVPTMELAAH